MSHVSHCAAAIDATSTAPAAETSVTTGRRRAGSTTMARGPSGVIMTISRRVSTRNASRRLSVRTPKATTNVVSHRVDCVARLRA